MKEKPIIFSSSMIRAILSGHKSCTRRLDKRWLKVKKGDRLWVRETWKPDNTFKGGGIPRLGIKWGEGCRWKEANPNDPGPWKPSIYMPKKFSRITLEATADARLERLQEITNNDIAAEGIEGLHPCGGAFPNQWREQFSKTWDSFNGKGSWDANPEVAVLTFKRIAK